MTRSLLLMLCLLVAAAAPVRAADDSSWTRVTSPNFVVYCNAGEARAYEVAEHLEGFRALLASVFPKTFGARRAESIPVVAFRSSGEFKNYRPLYGGQSSSTAGVFLRGSELALIALDASAWESASHVVLHEYLHHLHASDSSPIPLWFDEGTAEFFSTAKTGTTAGQVGKIVPGYMQKLRDTKFMPLDALFAVSHDSPDYRAHDRQGIFYAESWALVHYCITDPTQKRTAQLIDFVARQGHGEPIDAAFKGAFGTDTATMQKALEAYVRQSSVLVFDITFTTPVEIAKATAARAPGVEVEYYLGNILALEQRFVEAEPHFKKGMEIDAASSLPYEGIGFAALRKNDFAAAKAAFAEAVKRGAKGHLTLYYLAATSLDSARDAELPELRATLERAVTINPAFGGSYQLLSSLAIKEGDTKGATDWATRGLAVDPRNGRMRSNLALAQMGEGRLDEARTNLRIVVETSEDAATREYAKTLLASLDRRSAPAATTSAPEAEDDPPVAGSREVKGLGGEYPQVAEGSVVGTVTLVECTAKRLKVHVLVYGREQVFTSESPSAVIIATLGLDPSKRESVECGKALSREAYVQFDPASPGVPTGTLKAVLFSQPAP